MRRLFSSGFLFRILLFMTSSLLPSTCRLPRAWTPCYMLQNHHLNVQGGMTHWTVLRSRKRLEFVSAKRVQTPPLGSPVNRGLPLFQGSRLRCEQLVPPFRSHGRLAQLPENRGGSVGGIMEKGHHRSATRVMPLI